MVAGDIAAKAAKVHLIEIRLARGKGGKAFVYLCGELSAVKVAVKTAYDRLADEGDYGLIDHCLTASQTDILKRKEVTGHADHADDSGPATEHYGNAVAQDAA